MLNFKKSDLGKNTYQYDLTVGKDQIGKEYNQVFDKMILEVEVTGFRKGKVPRKIAEKHIKKDDVYKKVINSLLPSIYKELVTQDNLKPVVSPKIQLVSAEEGKDWEIRIVLAERPIIKLNAVKDKIKELNKSLKTADIWRPGDDKTDQKVEENKAEAKNKLLNKILEEILKTAEVGVSDLLIEEEMNRRLTQLVDDVRKVGLTVENYLKSKNQTLDSLKDRYKREIVEMYRLEFALDEIGESEKIVVEQSDLEKLFESIKDEKEREDARKNSYFYASFVKRQKTLDFLINL